MTSSLRVWEYWTHPDPLIWPDPQNPSPVNINYIYGYMIGYKYSITNKPWLIILLRIITHFITVYYGTAAFQLLYFPIASNGHLHSDPRPVGIQGRAHKNCDASACRAAHQAAGVRTKKPCWQRYLKIARNALRRARAQPLDILLRINYVLLRIWDGFALGTLSPWWTS